ncbi:MAG: phosphohistidine phosphatase SixA [Acidobacteriota bacterium]|nr:phosphohistidine phosphatase SixA [Acidobacteriota bacterium]
MPVPLELYLVRHATAEDRGVAWPDEARRPLSEDGKAGWRKASRGLQRWGVSIDLILTSPLVRARQTADILAAALQPHPPVVETDALAPGATLAPLLAALAAHGRRHRIALVGHEPDLGQLAARLAGLRQPLPFKKGAVCRIDFPSAPPEPPGTLRWFLPPGALRRMRG